MTKITKYKFHPKLVARTPRNPISFDLDEEILRQCFQKTVEKEAIFLASPHLYQAALDWQNGKTIEAKEKRKLLFSLAKYYIRSSFRPTPFGLFAGVGTTTWAEHTDIQLEAFNRQTRLDMTYLCALAYKISGLNPIKERLQYFKNSSLYTIGDEIRYVENYYESNRRFHKISAVKKNIYIIKVLKFVEKGGSSYSEIVSHLINNKNDKQEVIDFLDQLIDLQLLNSELEPSLTGNDFFYQIIKVLETINWDNDKTITTILSTLKDLDLRIKYLDENKINEPTEYFEIIQIIESLGVEYDINCLFQTDLGIITNLNSSVSDKYQRKIIEWIEFLQDINLNLPENNLEKFKTKFYGRFQNQEIQLSLALDTENGIGYLNKTNGDYTPLVEGIDFSNKQIKSFEFNDNQQKLFERLIEATHEGVYKIDLAAIPFEKTKKSDWTMPPSFNLLFREFENDTLYVESICGSSAATLLGRFAHKDSQISAIVREIVEEDEQLNPNVIFAEIVHLPENRTGNVIMHPHFHLYEIPYLAKSVLDKSNQIDLNDLYLSIVDDYLILRSAKLNKIVIPRLSNAHNYSDDALPVYQLLCDLQSQNTYQFLNFEWGDLANGFKFLPRVTYHSTIVSLATWSFKTEDLKNLKTVENFYELSKKYKIPDLFYLVDRDNELVVDPKNQLSFDVFIDSIKNNKSIVLKEYIAYSSNIQSNNTGETFANQFIGSIIHNENIYKKIELNVSKSANRDFYLGSEWLYYKIYCGAKAADQILINCLSKCINKANKL
ncbi:MAG: lantibiotic dehydratase family protein, partial [Bacteroidota bacterium]